MRKNAKTKKFLFALMLSMALGTNIASADLAEDIHNPDKTEHLLSSDYTFSDPVPEFSGNPRTFTIYGAAHAITSENKAGLSVVSGQTLTIQDVSSISNFITDTVNHGGFLTNAGKVNINALNNNITFTSNKVNGVYNDVYNTGTLNLNAGADKSITFGGSVAGSDGVLSVNEDATIPGGTYVFKGDIKDQILKIYNGATIKLDGSGVLKLAGFEPTSGDDTSKDYTVTLDLRNGSTDLHDFGKVIQGASVNHLLDVDINTGKADRFTARSTTAVNGQILLGGFNLLSGSGSEQKIINLSRNSFRFAMALKPGFDIATNINYATEDHYDVRTIDYDFLSGNLILNANEFTPNGGTIDLVYKTSKEYLEGSHYHYTDISDEYHETKYPNVVVLNGQVYFFKPNEGTELKNDAIIDLAATGSTAIREVKADDNYVFSKDGHYYSYSISALPKSIWDHTEAPDPADGYNYYKVVFDTDTNEYTTKYYDINLRTDFMYDIDTTKWKESNETVAKDYWGTVPPANIPIASSIKPDPKTGDLNSVSGMVAFYMPYKDFSTETRYYKYTYTVPDDYTRQTEREVLENDYITNKYFYGLTSSGDGGAVKNLLANGLNINADFIGNKSSASGQNNGGGAIYNGEGATLGFISGTFIDNYASQSGAAINNYKGDIKAIIGDFIGNNSDRAGGAIRNINGKIGMIHGQFIGNRSAVGNDSQGWGGAIASKNDTGTVPEIKIIQGNFIANNVGKGGGAIDINGKLGTVIGDFISNKAGSDGGGAIRVENGDIGSITGDFIGNSAHKGGAIQSQIKNNGKSHYGTICGDFIGNKATSGNGGAINNDSGSSSFDGVYGDFINNSASASGGAIYNLGTMTRVSANFMANKAGGNGGAIYNNENASITMVADDYGDILFVNNKDKNGSNAIYNNKGTINLKAETGHNITFEDTIKGSSGILNINNDDSTTKGGDYIFNNTISGNTVKLYNGAKVKLGKSDVNAANATVTYGKLSLNGLTNDANGGVIDSQNENIDAHSLTSLTLGSDLSYKIDVKLDTPGADTLKATSVTANGHNIIIDAINILTDSTSSPTQVVLTTDKAHFENLYKLSDNIALNVTKATGVKGFYSVSYSDFGTISGCDANKGILVFEGSENATLADAVRGYGQAKTYTQSGTENVEKDLGNLQGGSLVVQGGENYVINGGTKTGVTVDDTQTLKFNNISDVTGFNNDNTAVTNNGTLEITDSKFTSKIANNASMTLKGTNTLNGAITGDNGETVVSTGTTTVGSISQKAITIESTATKLVVTNGLTTTNGVTNNKADGLEVQGGDINSNISGTGTTNITGTVTNETGKTLDNAITVDGGAKLTTGAGTLQKAVTNSGTLNLTAGELTNAISGVGETEIIAGTGTVTVGTGGSIGNNLKITSGTLASDITKLGGTITNNATFNMTGDLSKNIAGASGTTILQSEAASVTNGTTIAGTLNVNGNTIAMNNSAYEKLTVGKLTGSGKLTLNVNANDNKADEIYIKNSGSDSVLTITTLNLTAPTDIETDLTKNFDEYKFSKQILTGSTGDAKIILGSGAVDPAYNVVDKAVTRTGTNTLATNNINWNDNYGGWKQSGLQNNKVEIVDNHTIKYSITKNWNGAKEYTTKAENLSIMNAYNDADRTVNFNGIHADVTAQGTYTVKADIGTSSAGKMTLNGERVGNSNTTVNLDGNAGFTLSNATELTINNIDMSGNTTLISVSNENAKVNLKNTNMQGAITGTKEFDLKTTETNVLQNVTKAKVDNSGNLSLSGTNNLVNISNAAGETEIKGGETTVGSINQKSVTIDSTATKLTVTNGITTTNGVTNNKTGGLEIQGGAVDSDILGTGSVDIAAGTGTVSLTAGKTISQQIDLKSGTFNTSASGIGTGITLDGGNVELTGGTLAKAISGTTGTTTIKTGNVSITDGSIGNNVVIDSGSLTSDIAKLGGTVTNNATFNMSGNLSKNIAGASGTTILQSEAASVTNGTTIAGSLNVNGNTIAMNNSAYEKLTVGKLTGTGNLTLNADASTITGKADTINITGTGSDSVLTITALNMTTPASVADEGYTYQAQIITGTPGNATIALSDNVIRQYASSSAITKTGTDELHKNTIKWNANYGGWTEDGTQTTGVSVVDGTKLQYQVTKTYDESTKTYTDKAENLAIMNQYDETGSENREVDFEGILSDPTAQGTYTVNADFGETKAGNFTIKGETNGENRAVIDFNTHSGFELNNNSTTITLKDVEVKGANDVKGFVSGTAGTDVKVSLDNVNIHDNGAGIKTAGDVEIKGNSTISDNIKVTGINSKIDIDGSDTVTLNSDLTGSGTSSKLNISEGTVDVGNNVQISALDVVLNNTTLNLANENSLNGVNTTFDGQNNLNLTNNNTNTLALGDVNLNGVLNMQVDADLANAKMDQISAASATIGAGGRIDVSKINLMSPTTQKQLDLLFTDNSTLAGVVNYTGEGQIAYSPIYKYNTSYVQKGDGKGYFSFVTQGSDYKDFNPSVMAASVTTIVTGYQNQMQALQQGFYHMDRYMKYSDSYRLAAENQNKIASLAPVTNLDINRVPETSQAMWVLPYTTFERVNLKGGVNVNNISYGMTYGGDSDMFDMGHGFKGVISGFVGYNGNHMTYDGVSITQNGGFLGATLNAYRGNFFTGLTVSTGASTGDADTMYGHDNITLLTAGIANKTGYNFEFMKGKVILQPSLFLGYSWVNTFDYTNSAGIKIKQDALNALQIAPGLKLIGNTKNGWQPYAGIDMVWNIFMGRNQATANDVVLPKLSERAYVQYGVGIQKTWADRFTGFLQAMVRNGGRNGIVLSAGFRWTFGKAFSSRFTSAKNKNITKQNRTVIKQQNKK